MANFSKVPPSGGTDYVPIKIAATGTPGTLFHTADSLATDEIWLWLTNTSAADVLVSVEFGGVTAPDNLLKFTVPANDTILAVPGIPLRNSKVARAFAASANVVNMAGHVNRIS